MTVAAARRRVEAVTRHFGDIVGSEADAEMFQKAFQGETIIKKAEK